MKTFISLCMVFLTLINNPILGQAIIGGSEIDISEAPWQVSLENSIFGDGHMCGGVIINEEWILTADHCVWLNLKIG